MEFPEFKEFNKIARWNRNIVVSEKLDGTNAQVLVNDTGDDLIAGSRNKWITPSDDNAGFARWVEANKQELLKLGPGSHYGEWWGQGIQRRYNLKEKRFSLFNSKRWALDRPSCCHVVPVLWEGKMEDLNLPEIMEQLKIKGSVASPGFMDPEGIVIFHEASNTLFKKTLNNDGLPKSLIK